MVPVLFSRRSEAPGGNAPRVNIVAIAVLLGAIGIGVISFMASGNPIALVVLLLAGVVLMQAPRIAKQ